MKKYLNRIFILCGFLSAISAQAGPGGPFEVSTGFSFSRTKYNETSYTWTRTWGGSFGFDLTPITQLEFSYSTTTTRNKIDNYEDTTFVDRMYSANVLQQLLSRNSPIQPYVKAGIGQMNRDASGTYANGVSPGAHTDSVTAILGAGIKVYLTRNLGLRAEATSYLTGARISSYKDNVGFTFGTSLSF